MSLRHVSRNDDHILPQSSRSLYGTVPTASEGKPSMVGHHTSMILAILIQDHRKVSHVATIKSKFNFGQIEERRHFNKKNNGKGDRRLIDATENISAYFTSTKTTHWPTCWTIEKGLYLFERCLNNNDILATRESGYKMLQEWWPSPKPATASIRVYASPAMFGCKICVTAIVSLLCFLQTCHFWHHDLRHGMMEVLVLWVPPQP